MVKVAGVRALTVPPLWLISQMATSSGTLPELSLYCSTAVQPAYHWHSACQVFSGAHHVHRVVLHRMNALQAAGKTSARSGLLM
jgi:hypothetical protein